MKRVDLGVYNNLEFLVKGEGWQSGLYILEAANDGVGTAPPHDATVPQEVLDKVAEISAGLADGSIDTGVDPATGELLK
jgi:basic membrane lipoprotein Med (substrate-binding protein (PBP1-ABC) superfamily)